MKVFSLIRPENKTEADLQRKWCFGGGRKRVQAGVTAR